MVQLVSPRHDDVAGCVQSGRLNRAHQLATDTVTAMETRREVKRHESIPGQSDSAEGPAVRALTDL